MFNGLVLHRIYRFVFSPGSQAVGTTGRSASETRRGLVASLYEIYLRTLFMLYVSFAIIRLIKRNNIDAVVERETSFGAGGLASLVTRKPMVLEIVGPRYSRISVWWSKKILYYTDSMLRAWVDRNKCLEVSSGVNTSFFHEDPESRKVLRQKFGFNVQHCVIGYVGTFQDWHGIDTLLYSINDLKTRNKDVRALLVGPYFEKYQQLAKGLGLLDICTFSGPMEYEKVADYINACDIMVALYEPERSELRRRYGIGAPLKILEYMACGKPVISTGVKPIDKLIQNGDSGYLVKPGDKKGLVFAISTLMNDRSKLSLLGENGRKTVETHYSWENIARIIENEFTGGKG